jgi:hypothetical protein
MLFVGSCFADSIGQRFREEGFPVTVNPYGTMYNPASILHTIEKTQGVRNACVVTDDTSFLPPCVVFLTLGTNRVYRLKETGEIVDNCEKRPQSLFTEEELTVDECADYLMKAIGLLRQTNPDVRIVLTVSPIRYRKYGYHGSQLSKATLLLAVEKVVRQTGYYFPAYEILNDELRDYRFYAPDMLHPSQQAVDYIWERLVETFFSAEAKTFLEEWRPLKQALGHKPFHPDSPEYLRFQEQTRRQLESFKKKYPAFKGEI